MDKLPIFRELPSITADAAMQLAYYWRKVGDAVGIIDRRGYLKYGADGQNVWERPCADQNFKLLKETFEGSDNPAVKVEEVTDEETKNTTNVYGLELETVQLETFYSRNLGTDPRAQFADWKKYLGKAYPLNIGGERFGPNYLQLRNVNMTEIEVMQNGVILSAKVALSFVEYRASNATVTVAPSITADVENVDPRVDPDLIYQIVLGLGSSSEDKANMKPSVSLYG